MSTTCDRTTRCERLNQAAARGHVDCMATLRGQGQAWDHVCDDAAGNRRLEALVWARERGAPWDAWTCWRAAKNGDLQIVKWAIEHGVPLDESVCDAAAERGDYEMLSWAHEHGAPLGESVCAIAAARGDLDVLRYSHKHGAPWGAGAFLAAAKSGHFEVACWLHEHGAPLGRARPPPPRIDVDGEELFVVDFILDHKEVRRGKKVNRTYLVKWRGYGAERNSWEPESAMIELKAYERYWDYLGQPPPMAAE